MICTPAPRGAPGCPRPDTAPALAQVEHAGAWTISMGDRGAAALCEVLKLSTLPFGDLGATRRTKVRCLDLEKQKIATAFDAKRTSQPLSSPLIGCLATLSSI